jgi:hypothetical protein
MSTLAVGWLQDKVTGLKATGQVVVKGNARAFAQFNGVANSWGQSFNTASYTDHSTGQYSFSFNTAFSSTRYACTAGLLGDLGWGACMTLGGSGGSGALFNKAVGIIQFRTTSIASPAYGDLNEISAAFLGTQA